MDRIRPSRPELDDLTPYDAMEPHAAINLSSNENAQNLPTELLERLAENMGEFPFNRYPDPMGDKLRTLIAEANGLEPDNVLIGNGGDELIFNLLLAWGGPGRKLLNMPPTFAMYAIDAQMTGTEIVAVPRLADFSVDAEAVLSRLADGGIDLVYIAHPNNPTGNLQPETFLIDVLNATDAIVLVDEAYFEFSRHTMRPHMERHPNLVILRTFSKAFSLAAMRVGYLLAHPDVISELTKVRQPYSVNRFSQWVAAIVFRDRVLFEGEIREIVRRRDVLMHGLSSLEGIEVFPSEANFVLFRVEHAAAVWRDLLRNRDILVRDFSSTPQLEDCLRVSVGSAAENAAFLEAMGEIVAQRRTSAIFGTTNGEPIPEPVPEPAAEAAPRAAADPVPETVPRPGAEEE
jgi:histidinol-phosphate aminotransferase